MLNNKPICIIGGYDLLSKSFFSELRAINPASIFINVNGKKPTQNNVFNYQIYELKKIFELLERNTINSILFLGKISRPNLNEFKTDGVIDKFIPLLMSSYKKGDGQVLSSVIKIFSKKGFKIENPRRLSNEFFLSKEECKEPISSSDKNDIKKSIAILNDLSKYDNAQSVVSVNGYIIAIEAAEGTDNLLKRTINIRKSLNQIQYKAGVLTKIPKKNQSKLVDLPVIGIKTLNYVKNANLNAIAIDTYNTMIYQKNLFLKKAKEHDLKIYDLSL